MKTDYCPNCARIVVPTDDGHCPGCGGETNSAVAPSAKNEEDSNELRNLEDGSNCNQSVIAKENHVCPSCGFEFGPDSKPQQTDLIVDSEHRRQLFFRVKPLEDPLLQWLTVIQVSFVLVILSQAALLESPQPDPNDVSAQIDHEKVVIAFLNILPLAIGLIVFLYMRKPLLERAKSRPLLFIRSFSRDFDTSIRMMLESVVPDGIRVCGIRAPRNRVPWIVDFLTSSITFVQSLASPRFELRAPSRNWLVRFCKSAHGCGGFIIDFREISRNVEVEIRLAWKIGGEQYCKFLVKENEGITQSKERLAKILGIGDSEISKEIFVKLKGETSCKNLSEMRTVKKAFSCFKSSIVSVPSGGINFVATILPESSWSSRWQESNWTAIIANFLVFSSVPLLIPEFGFLFGYCLALFSALIFFVGIGRLARIAMNRKHLGYRSMSSPLSMRIRQLFLILVSLFLIATLCQFVARFLPDV